jgi:restriction system protein
MNDMQHQLSDWKTALQTELAALQRQAAAISTAIAEKRAKIEAIDRLIGGPANPQMRVDLAASAQEAAVDATFTPVKAYWKPLLETLVELGGRGRRRKVIELVGRRMDGTLTPADYEKLNSGVIRWENRVAWQANAMRSDGLLKAKKDLPRGVWEITDAGRQWLANNS